MESQKERYVKAINKYISLYGDNEVAIISVPGRSEVCGNHTDHQHGEVLAAAINLDIIAVVGLQESVKVLSDGYDLKEIFLNDLAKKDEETGTKNFESSMYASPELNTNNISNKCDIYSIGKMIDLIMKKPKSIKTYKNTKLYQIYKKYGLYTCRAYGHCGASV